MKVALILTVGLFAALAACDMTKEEAKEMMMSMTENCREQEKPSEEEIDNMMNEKMPKTKEGKCYMKCCFFQFGLMVEETPKPPEFSVEGYKAMMGMALGDDEEKNKIAAEIAEKCKSLTHEDHCEMAFLLAKCMADEAEARGLKKA